MGSGTQGTDTTGWQGKPTFMVDVIVNNTDRNPTRTDMENDGETSIAVNPRNPDEIVISAFSGFWGANAPIYHTFNGGRTWTREFSVPNPLGWPTVPVAGPSCDWTWDYGRNDELSGAILDNSPTVPSTVANTKSMTSLLARPRIPTKSPPSTISIPQVRQFRLRRQTSTFPPAWVAQTSLGCWSILTQRQEAKITSMWPGTISATQTE